MKDSSTANVAICIAGAHRSGTSMLTRLLHACGLYLGPEKALMPAQADNPDGFWEHLGFVALNDELLNALGGAWDLPPKVNENFGCAELEPLRTKARLLIEGFDSAHVWGWKDPRNSLTLPFWQDLLPSLKTLMIVRNPLEVAHSMRERNGTSYAFGLRLWEIYNRRLIEAASKRQRFVTHYDLFFDNAERELRRIANFIGLPDAKICSAAKLVATRRRHTHFTIDQLIDARVSEQVIELYRALIEEASARRKKASVVKSGRMRSDNADLLLGAVSRLNAFVPESIAQIEHLYGELLGQAEARHKIQIEEIRAHLTRTDARHKEQVEELMARHKAEIAVLAEAEERHKAQVEKLKNQLTHTEAQHNSQAEELQRLETELAQVNDRFLEVSTLLHRKRVSLSEHERRVIELRGRLRKELWSVRKLSQLLEDAAKAAVRLRSSRRWKLVNPVNAIRAKLSHGKVPRGYGHLEKIITAYSEWRAAHPEIAKIEDEIRELRVPLETKEAGGDLQKIPQRVEAPVPPLPALPVESICFPTHKRVEVSIIIPVFNQFHYTHACLASLQTVEERVAFEVIVVDDCSTDHTAELVPQMDGVVYCRNEANSGFIVSCNRGAKKARGKYLVFLNNDTVVKAGWLTALLDTFADEPQAGIVGSKLVYPDGRLQEAGGIIWRDGSGWNHGKFDEADKPEYNYLREVDYCSAAALMIPKAVFEEVAGFDRKYAPAYYEDTDLAFKVRKNGYRVLYQPLSEIHHYEGVTGGTDLTTGTKKYQDINRITFAESWATELASKPTTGDVASLQNLPAGKKNILVVDHHLPMPDRDSGSLRMFQVLKLLHQLGHRVTFIPANLANQPPYTGELQKRGIQVVYYPYIKSVREYLILHGAAFDVVILSRCDFASKFIADVREHAPQSRIIFDTVDLHFLREDRRARITGNPEAQREALEKQRLEYDLIRQADETWVVSDVERQLLQQREPEKSIQVVSNIVDVPGSKTPFSLRRDWLFIGGFLHPPNIDAVLFFMEKIYPLVKERLPGAKFYVIGDKAPPEVVALASDNVIITGLQSDVRPFFDSVKLSIAPLRYGAGVKGKINQSMGFGVPVVATSLAVEGMALRDRENVLIADEPEDFARGMIELYQSESLWDRLSKNSVERTKAMYSVSAARERLRHLFSDAHFERVRTSALKTLTSRLEPASSRSRRRIS